MDIRSVVPLDENSLIACAKANVGLEDFGDDSWYEPFQVLVKSLDDEANLNLMGRLMTRSDLLLFLQARLQVEDVYKQHPEISDEEIVKPIFIIGQGRSGTSVLQNMLSADPDCGTTTMWEVFFPAPPPEKATYRTDPRIEKADKLVTQLNRVVPEFEAMHEWGAEVPTETIQVHGLTFVSPWFNAFMGQASSYMQYLQSQDLVPVYEYEKRVLKLLQWKNPRRTWVMKTPYYIQHLPTLLQVYPDAGLVWTHRDPVKALASAVNMVGTMFWSRSDTPFIGKSFEMYTNADQSAAMMTRPIDWLDSGRVPRDRLYNLQYLDFIRDPVGSARQIYDYFGIEMTEEGANAMRRYMADNPRSSRPSHRYDVGPADQVLREREAYRRYQEHFDVPTETG